MVNRDVSSLISKRRGFQTRAARLFACIGKNVMEECV